MDRSAAVRERFRERARELGILGDDAHLDVLAQVVADNDAVMAAVVASDRVRSEDPADFVRMLRGWRERHGA
jgi:hypothetical protein